MSTSIIAIELLGYAISGIAGNRADSLFVNTYKEIVRRLQKGGKPINHDLERAVRKSYLNAILVTCVAIEKAEKKKSGWKNIFVENTQSFWVNTLKKDCKKELKRVNKDTYIPPESDTIIEPSLFLEPKGLQGKELAKKLQQSLIQSLFDEVSNKYGTYPPIFKKYIEEGWKGENDVEPQSWFAFVCAFFASELKTNERLKTLFEGKILAELKVADIPLKLEMIHKELKESSKQIYDDLILIQNLLLDQKFTTERTSRDLKDFKSVLIAQSLENRTIIEKLSARNSLFKKYTGQEISDRVAYQFSKAIDADIAGREVAFSLLDRMLGERDSGRLILTAPAGYGKTTLLAHWIESRHNDEIFIAYHFFTPYTSSIRDTYLNILRQLFAYYELSEENIPDTTAQIRDAIYGLIVDKGAREEEPLIVIFDALDEAEQPFSPPFPSILPKGVFVIASIRSADNQLPDEFSLWGKEANFVHLELLNEGAVEKLIISKGILDELPEKPPAKEVRLFFRQVYEKTQGYPLYIHYLIDEIKREAKNFLSLTNILGNTPIGFESYVKEQFRSIAQKENLKGNRELQKLFALLAVALGPLEEDDIQQITGLSLWDLQALPWDISRWFNIQKTDNRILYSFSHPLLSQMFEKTLGRQASMALNSLIDYCSRWEEHQSLYSLQYYSLHLKNTGQRKQLTDLLIQSNKWRKTKRDIFFNDISFISDLNLAIDTYKNTIDSESLQPLTGLHLARKISQYKTNQISKEDLQLLIYLGEEEKAKNIAYVHAKTSKNINSLANIFDFLCEKEIYDKQLETDIISFTKERFFDTRKIDTVYKILLVLKNKNTFPVRRELALFIFENIFQVDLTEDDHLDYIEGIQKYLNSNQKRKLRNQLLKVSDHTGLKVGKRASLILSLEGKNQVSNLRTLIEQNNTYYNVRSEFIIGLCNHNFVKDAIELYEILHKEVDRLKIGNEKKTELLKESAVALANVGAPKYVKIILEKWGQDMSSGNRFSLFSSLKNEDKKEIANQLIPLLEDSFEQLFYQVLIHLADPGQNTSSENRDWQTLIFQQLRDIENEDNLEYKRFWIRKIINEVSNYYKTQLPKEVIEFMLEISPKLEESSGVVFIAKILIEHGHLDQANSFLNNNDFLKLGKILDQKEIALTLAKAGALKEANQHYQSFLQTPEDSEKNKRELSRILSIWAYFCHYIGAKNVSDYLFSYHLDFLHNQIEKPYWVTDCQLLLSLALARAEKTEEAIDINEKIKHPIVSQLTIDQLLRKGEFKRVLKIIPNLLLTSKDRGINTTAYKYQYSESFFDASILFLLKTHELKEHHLIEEFFSVTAPLINSVIDYLLESGSHKSTLTNIEDVIAYLIVLERLGYSNKELFVKLIDYLFEYPAVNSDKIDRKFALELAKNSFFSGTLQLLQNFTPSEEIVRKIWNHLPKEDSTYTITELQKFCISNTSIEEKSSLQEQLLTLFDENEQEKDSDPSNFVIGFISILKHWDDHPSKEKICFEWIKAILKVYAWENPRIMEIINLIPEPNFSDKPIAKKHLDSVQEERPLTPNLRALVLFWLGEKNFKQGDMESAITLYSEAIDCSPSLLKFRLKRGIAYLIVEQFDKAILDLNICYQNNKEKSLVLPWLIRSLLAKKEIEIALSIVRDDQEIEDYIKHYWKARIYYSSKEFDAALNALEFVEKNSDPTWTSFDENLVKINIFKGLIYNAQSLIELAIEFKAKAIEHLEKIKDNYRHTICSLFSEMLPSPSGKEPLTVLFSRFNELAPSPRIYWVILKELTLLRLEAKLSPGNLNEDSNLGHISDWANKTLLKRLENTVANKKKGGNSKNNILEILEVELGINEHLLFEQAVVLIRGTNQLGFELFSYLKLSLFDFTRLSLTMANGENFMPSDYGEVVESGYGYPSEEVLVRMREKFHLTEIPTMKPWINDLK